MIESTNGENSLTPEEKVRPSHGHGTLNRRAGRETNRKQDVSRGSRGRATDALTLDDNPNKKQLLDNPNKQTENEMIELPDGTICFPTRGKAPALKEGYEYVRGYKFKQVPILLPCIERGFDEADCEGCGDSARMTCAQKPETRQYLNHDLKTITRKECQKCPIRKSPENKSSKPVVSSTVQDAVSSSSQPRETKLSQPEMEKDSSSMSESTILKKDSASTDDAVSK